MSYVIVDAPRTGGRNVLPTVVATTSPTAYVRFHGRNAQTWNKRTGSAAERFDYLYSEDELREWVEPLAELSGQPENVYAMFNNNGRSTMPGLPSSTARPSTGRAGAGERADAAVAARARGPPGHARSAPVASRPWSPGRTSSPAASTSTPSRARS